jgi:hypothetical protein
LVRSSCYTLYIMFCVSVGLYFVVDFSASPLEKLWRQFLVCADLWVLCRCCKIVITVILWLSKYQAMYCASAVWTQNYPLLGGGSRRSSNRAANIAARVAAVNGCPTYCLFLRDSFSYTASLQYCLILTSAAELLLVYIVLGDFT